MEEVGQKRVKAGPPESDIGQDADPHRQQDPPAESGLLIGREPDHKDRDPSEAQEGDFHGLLHRFADGLVMLLSKVPIRAKRRQVATAADLHEAFSRFEPGPQQEDIDNFRGEFALEFF